MWRKSTHSESGNCAEIAAWRTSTHSNGTNCAEVSQDGAVVGVRDSQDPGGPVLTFSPAAWTGFLARLRDAPS